MKYKFSCLILLLMLFVSFPANAINFNAEETYNSVVVVYTNTSVGSGFSVKENLLVTNAHVVENNKTVTIELYNGNSIKGTVIKTDTKKDLALIQVNHSIPVLEINTDKQSIGNEVYAIGAPKDMPYTMTKGIISALDREIDKNKYIQLDASVNSGNSGGPLIDDYGKVIGVITLKASNAEGIGFAIPAEDVIAFIEGISPNPENYADDTVDIPTEFSPYTNQDNITPQVKNPNESLIIAIIILSVLLLVSVLIILRHISKKHKQNKDILDFDIDITEQEKDEDKFDFEIELDDLEQDENKFNFEIDIEE